MFSIKWLVNVPTSMPMIWNSNFAPKYSDVSLHLLKPKS